MGLAIDRCIIIIDGIYSVCIYDCSDLFQIICCCGKDEEQWVRVMAEVVKPLLETQSLEASVSGSIHNDVMETLRSVCE